MVASSCSIFLRFPRCPEPAGRFGCAEGCSSSVPGGGRTQKSSPARDELYTRGATLVGQIHCPSRSGARPDAEAMPLPDNGGFRLDLLGSSARHQSCTRRPFGLRLRGPLAALFPWGLHCPPLAMGRFCCDDLPLQRLCACTRFSCKTIAIPC